MTHTPPILVLSHAALELFLGLLPPERISHSADRIVVHPKMGEVIWFARGDHWFTAAPGFDTARRFGAKGPVS